MPGPPETLRFGAFMAPYHAVGEGPTLALERDLELIARLDELGYDEVWVGEHHSTGWETIASPEIFLAVAAERTRRIRLGTGAVSLPYHHPLMVADRIVLLDHLTRGRVMFGVGPGGHITDALMLGIEPTRLRPMMDEALGVILRLMTDTAPLNVESDWFRLRDAVLQLRPYQRPHPPLAVTSLESPAGMALAGRHGAGVLSLAVTTTAGGPVDLAGQWRVSEEAAAAAGTAVSRDDWRLCVPIHLAETRRRALDEARDGAARFLLEYVQGTTGRPAPVPGPPERVVDQMVERGSWVVGTPDDCAAALERLLEVTGGFGAMLVWAHEWAPREATLRSYELLAREVMPRFQGALAGIEASNALARARSDELHRLRTHAADQARAEHERRAAEDQARAAR
jgi:limonene 1,2-monooxygenase